LHQVVDLFELNVELRCQKVNYLGNLISYEKDVNIDNK